MLQIKIAGHLLIPFGCPKWDIDKIKIAGVSTEGTYFTSDTPFVYIDTTKQTAVRLRDFASVFPETFSDLNDTLKAFTFIKNYLKEKCNLQTKAEQYFLDLYFDYCQDKTTPPSDGYIKHFESTNTPIPIPFNDPEWIFETLLPLPQAHLYLKNPLQDDFSFIPKNMVKVDFVFWTGKKLIAIEIDGSSHIGSEKHIHRDRMLQRAGVEVIHILNNEIFEYGKKVIFRLLPRNITRFWESVEAKYRYNPLGGVPF